MIRKINYLLIGNSRLHWAKEENNYYEFFHTTKEETPPQNINLDNLIWASVSNQKTIKLNKNNQMTIKSLKKKGFPTNFGIDRAFGCIAAIKLIKNPLKKNIIIADFGTILSITKIDIYGKVIGGQLIPGFLTQLKSMEKNTKNLKYPKCFEIPNKEFLISTTEAMRRGVYSSLIGALKLIVDSEKDLLIICGGDANLFGNCIKKTNLDSIIEANLVMRGMILAQQELS